MTDRDFLKYFSVMIGALITLTVAIFFLANAIGGKKTEATVADAKAVAERIKPVGELSVVSVVANAMIPAANAAGADGTATYNASCASCHAAGVAGAPKFGDKAAWAPRIAKGMDTLYTVALKGKPGTAMMAKGGNASLKDDAVKAAVDHMVNAAK